MISGMGKLLQFPVSRFRNRRAAATVVFSAFDELDSVERAQAKLIVASVLVASLVSLLLQLASG